MSLHDRWKGARKGPGKRWELRYRDPDGVAHKKRFELRDAALGFEAKRRISPELKLAVEGRTLTVDAIMQTWLGTKGALRQGTLDAYAVDSREVLATFGGRLAASVKPSEVRTWVARPRGYSLRERSLRALKAAYELAIADKVLTSNPCAGIAKPRAVVKEPRYLSWDELGRLADAAGEWAPLIWLLGTTGLRIGEAIGLQVGDVTGSRIRVQRTVSYNSTGALVGPPKSGKGRDVPVPNFVLGQLPTAKRAPSDWLFVGPHGARLDAHSWRARVFNPAAVAAGLGDLHPHSLRHTAASLAIAAGADVKVVQQMLGHTSAAMTFDRYGHLFSNRLDEVAEKMAESARASKVYLREVL
jgi:integrase